MVEKEARLLCSWECLSRVATYAPLLQDSTLTTVLAAFATSLRSLDLFGCTCLSDDVR